MLDGSEMWPFDPEHLAEYCSLPAVASETQRL